MNSGVYVIKCSVSGKVYVGKTRDFKKRWNNHRSSLNNQNIETNPHLQAEWNKYGEENFEFAILERCSDEQADFKEIEWMKKFNSLDRKFGYNIEDRVSYRHIGGESNPRSILSKGEAISIYNRLKNGEVVIDISKELGLSPSTVQNIKKAHHWVCKEEGLDPIHGGFTNMHRKTRRSLNGTT